jgi:cytochrome oxidase assembly protein ShyY1
MIKRLPVLPTILVAAAVAVMVGLGLWQVKRAQWKEGLLERYASAGQLPLMAWPTMPPAEDRLPLFRRASGHCLKPEVTKAVAGQNRSGESGYVFIVDCATGAEGPGMRVQVGWSKNPKAEFQWAGGPVTGVVAPDQQTRMRLVADQAPPGLEPSARPSLAAISNNHRLYAIQWFAFAAIAILIYGLALRGRSRPKP